MNSIELDFEQSNIDSLVHEVNLRMRFLRANQIVCPQCKGRQVQLLQIKMIPAWKCKHCGYKYVYEPIKIIKEKLNEEAN